MNRDLIISKTAMRFFMLRKLDHYVRRVAEMVVEREPNSMFAAYVVKTYKRVHDEMHEAEE